MKIYTKTGDKGTTSLIGGKRVKKCCERLEAYGTVDELNSQIGLLITYCTDEAEKKFLSSVQCRLFVVGGYLATPSDYSSDVAGTAKPSLENDVADVEKEIDRLQSLVPQIRYFILPGGSRGAAAAHVCRTVCRRTERCILRLAEAEGEIDANVVAYVNRLSDYFFVLARKLNVDNNIKDIKYE